ncbi:methyltransferase [Pseudomonas jilinensis]|uniref:50S rRNA methyltransferase n=1 Tax=Pseudomonas jilinensis TaxID=2078689 RepID=A0A396RWU5_9PSED|nr:methyltransferase [Pseudomonas jilinensis]RHW19862.1 50S rRNA methyltransferase [Pseudomonas jilinensis]
MQTCDTPFGALSLGRYPPTRNPTLQAFDAADQYLLQRLHEDGLGEQPILVINDAFGALAIALAKAGHRIHSWGDSWLAQRAMQDNLQANGLDADCVQFIDSQSLLPEHYQQVLLRIPKSLSLLESQLRHLHSRLQPQALVLAGAMIKHLPPSAGDLLARYIGPYQASLAWKKARLLCVRAQTDLNPPTSELNSHYPLPDTALQLHNLPGVFSRNQLDIGTRVLLPCIPRDLGNARVVDLGCGNGALGLFAAWHNPEIQPTFIDESYAAVASARKNFHQGFAGREAQFLVSDGLTEVAPASAELILCNPPFHQQQVIGDEIALRLFKQSRQVLAPSGSLLVVGNRHLGYHIKLKRFFQRVEQLGSSAKFVAWRAWR